MEIGNSPLILYSKNMRQSQLFSKTSKNSPKDEAANNAKLLIRGGFIHKEMAGVYTYLPLGLRVLDRIARIIREEINAIGGQELLMTTLQDPEIWKKSGRWVEEEINPQTGLAWFKTKLVGGAELGIANTHEEAIANILAQHISSYKDLPLYVYQIQNKFRNELRAKSGLMRAREFIMKDLYSFSRNEEEFKIFYEKCAAAYLKIFHRVGLGHCTYRAFASGGAFSKFSDEFQTLSLAGEDIIYIHEKKKIAINKEVYDNNILKNLGLKKSELKKEKAIEVGNIFPLGTKYSQALGLYYKDERGERQPVFMGSYGIGLGRLVGAVVEVHHDDHGIVWPTSVAPYQIHLLELGAASAGKVYDTLVKKGIEVLYDDRPVSAGEKFADADLIGLPWRAIVSPKTGAKIELKPRASNQIKLVTAGELLKKLAI